MGVFTTRSLLHALGVSQGAASTAVAANWVIKVCRRLVASRYFKIWGIMK